MIYIKIYMSIVSLIKYINMLGCKTFSNNHFRYWKKDKNWYIKM